MFSTSATSRISNLFLDNQALSMPITDREKSLFLKTLSAFLYHNGQTIFSSFARDSTYLYLRIINISLSSILNQDAISFSSPFNTARCSISLSAVNMLATIIFSISRLKYHSRHEPFYIGGIIIIIHFPFRNLACMPV